jgi:MbtH protein
LQTVSFGLDSPEAQFRVLIDYEEQDPLWPAKLEASGGRPETGVYIVLEGK